MIPITVVLGLLIAIACAVLALGLMVGHAIGYHKGIVQGRKEESVKAKALLNDYYGKFASRNEPI